MVYEKKRKVLANIIQHQEDNYFFRKDEGGEVILPWTWLHPFQTEIANIKVALKETSPKQLYD